MGQYVIMISGHRGEHRWGGISTLMQRKVKMANVSEYVDRSAVRPTIASFLEHLVPQSTKVALQFGKGVLYDKFGNVWQNPRRNVCGIMITLKGVKDLASNVDQVGK